MTTLTAPNQIKFSGSKWSSSHKSLLAVCIILFLIAAGLAVALGVMVTRMQGLKQHERICNEPVCVKAAASLVANMDLSANPCHDFYQYACGGWKEKNDIPDDKAMWSTFDIMDEELYRELRALLSKKYEGPSKAVEKVIQHYKLCLDEDTINNKTYEPLTERLQDIIDKGWPLLYEATEWNETDFDLTQFLIDLGPDSGKYLYDFGLMTDTKNSTKNVLYLDQASLGLGYESREYYLDPVKYAKYIDAYRKLMVDLAEIMGAATNNTNYKQDLVRLLEFETDIARATVHGNLRRNVTNHYNPRTLLNITQTYTQVDWKRYVFHFVPKHANVTENETIILYQPEYFNDMENFLSSGKYDSRQNYSCFNRPIIRCIVKVKNTTSWSPDGTVVNYILWRVTLSYSWHVHEPFRTALFEFDKATTGIKKQNPRWRDCLKGVRSRLKWALGYLYVTNEFVGNSRQLANELIASTKLVFKDRVRNSKWMSAKTKQKAIEKVDTIYDMVGYPDYYENVTILDEKHKNFTSTGSYFSDIVEMRRLKVNESFAELRKPVNKTEWFITPAIFNAFYRGSNNAIVFPAGILRSPFFHKDLPMFMNIAGITHVVAHEVTHGFDDRGRQFDKDGNHVDWWTPEDEKRFLEGAKCFISQFNNYTEEALGKVWHLNGTLLQGETIADSGGVLQAYEVYRRWLKDNAETEQRLPGINLDNKKVYFVNQAQMWCGKIREEFMVQLITSEYHPQLHHRVRGEFSNSPDFAKVFNCPTGSRMNPAKKCAIW